MEAQDPGTTGASHQARVSLGETEAQRHLPDSSGCRRTVAPPPAVAAGGRAPRLGLRSSWADWSPASLDGLKMLPGKGRAEPREGASAAPAAAVSEGPSSSGVEAGLVPEQPRRVGPRV